MFKDIQKRRSNTFKFIIINLLLIAFFGNIFPKETPDNLVEELNKAKDENKSHILNKLAETNLWGKDKNIPFNYAKESIKLAKKFQQKKELCKAYIIMVYSHWRFKKNKVALKYANKSLILANSLPPKIHQMALDAKAFIYNYLPFTKKNLNILLNLQLRGLRIAQDLNDEKKSVDYYHGIGSVYSLLNDEKNRFIYRQKTLEMYRKLGDKEGVVQMLTYIGYHYYNNEGMNDNALKCFLEAESIAKRNSFKKLLCRVYEGKGIFFMTIGDLKKAEIAFLEGLDISGKNNFSTWQTSLHLYLGILSLKQDRYKKALHNLNRAAEENNKNKTTSRKSLKIKIHTYLGETYSRLNDDDKALFNFSKSIELSTHEKSFRALILSYQKTGEHYHRKGNIESALKELNNGLKLLKKVNKRKYYNDYYSLLKKIYSQVGNTKKAQEYEVLLNSF